MRKAPFLVGAALLILSLVLLLVAAQRGEVTISLFVVFPLLTVTGVLGAIGALLLFPSIVLLLLSLFPAPAEGPEGGGSGTEGSYGGVVLIGPFPILFGSARGLRGSWLLILLVVLGALLTVMMLIILLS